MLFSGMKASAVSWCSHWPAMVSLLAEYERSFPYKHVVSFCFVFARVRVLLTKLQAAGPRFFLLASFFFSWVLRSVSYASTKPLFLAKRPSDAHAEVNDASEGTQVWCVWWGFGYTRQLLFPLFCFPSYGRARSEQEHRQGNFEPSVR